MGLRSGVGFAGTGASIGSAIAPGLGTIIGGASGFLAGLFMDDEEEQEQYHSPYESLIRAQMLQLENDRQPSAQYQANRADATRAYDRSVERINNRVGGNVAVASRFEEMAGEQLGSNLQRAAAVENDRIKSVRQQAANLAMGQQQIDVSNYRYAKDNSGPTWLAQLGEGMLGLDIGKKIGQGKGLLGLGDSDAEDVEMPDAPVIDTSGFQPPLPEMAPPSMPSLSSQPMQQPTVPVPGSGGSNYNWLGKITAEDLAYKNSFLKQYPSLLSAGAY